MRKFLALLVVICGLAIPVAAVAADWNPQQNQDLVAAGAACEQGNAGAWYHFVNNQTGGAAAGLLTVVFTNPSGPVEPSNPVGPLAVNQNVQHFYVWAEGTLVSASTNIPGRLVISGIACGKKTDSPRDLFD
jgi:hypothetical protein